MPRPVTASREYVKRKGAPKSPEDLARHDLVAVGNVNSWMLTGPKGKVEVAVRGVQRYRAMAGVVNAVAAGTGIAPLPSIYFDEPEFQDILVPVLGDYRLREAMLYLVYVSRRYVPLKLRALIDFLIEYSSKFPEIKLPAAG